MKSPVSRPHLLDIWDPLVHLPYLGDPIDSFIELAKSDGWEVDLYDDSPPKLGATLREQARIITLQARYDYVPVAVRDGRVVAIGQQAPFYR